MADTLATPLADLCSAVQGSLSIPFVRCNVYISPLDSMASTPLHTDRVDSFVLQAQGSKRWRVFDTSDAVQPWPIVDAGFSERGKNGDVLYLEHVGPLLLDDLLQPGDVLYIPRGVPHATSTFGTQHLHCEGRGAQARFSTSMTLSLLLEPLGLTYDKVLRCTAGVIEGPGGIGPCPGAEEVLKLTPFLPGLREVLPVGFLSREQNWVDIVSSRAFELASSAGLPCLASHFQSSSGRAVLQEVLTHIWHSLQGAQSFYDERIAAGGAGMAKLSPAKRQQAGIDALGEFKFYPQQGLIFVQPPRVSREESLPVERALLDGVICDDIWKARGWVDKCWDRCPASCPGSWARNECRQHEVLEQAAVVVVVLRGEGFRMGGQHSRDTGGCIEEQRRALKSAELHVLGPLRQKGWEPLLLVDVVFNRGPEVEQQFREMVAGIGAELVRLRPQSLATQGEAVSASVEWALESAPHCSAIFLARIDLLFHANVPLPAPEVARRHSETILAPWVIWPKCNQSLVGHPRVGDTLFFVPRPRAEDFVRVVAGTGWLSLHELADQIVDVDVLFVSQHDTDSAKDWNPLYTMIGRNSVPFQGVSAVVNPMPGRRRLGHLWRYL